MSLAILAGIALLGLALVALKHWGTARADRASAIARPHLFLPGAPLALRVALGTVLLAGFVLLAWAGRDAPAIAAISAALLMHLRGGMRFESLAGTGAVRAGWREMPWDEARAFVRAAGARDGRARLFLDATSLPGAALALLLAGGIVSIAFLVLGEVPAERDLVLGAGSLLVVFGFLTSTRLGGSARLAARTLAKLRRVARTLEESGREPPLPSVSSSQEIPVTPDMRLRSGDPGTGICFEVGVEWTRAWSGWRGRYTVIIDLDAMRGALVADAPWLERAEIHTSLEMSRTAILVRTADPSVPGRLLARVADHLGAARTSCDASLAMGVLSGEAGPAGEGCAPLDPRPAAG